VWDIFEKFIREYFHDFQEIYDVLPYPLKYLATSIRGYPLAKIRYSKLFEKYLTEIITHEKYSPIEMKSYQDYQVRNIVKFAFQNIPYYKKKWGEIKILPEDIKGANDLWKLPILQREEIKKHWQEFINPNIPEKKRIKTFTSGTSGSGLPVIHDNIAEIKNWAFIFRQLFWAGVKPKDWRITMFGGKVTPPHRKKPPFWSYNYPGRQILLSIYHLSPQTVSYYIEFFEKHNGLLLEGFPSALDIISKFILEKNRSFQMKAVYSTGEPLYAPMRKRIEKSFNTKVYNAYGMSEMVGLIQECEKGSFHLISDYGCLEIIDDRNNLVEDGKEGYLIWTGFINTAMPLIRYQIGDKGILKRENTCICGRPFPIVDATITRDSDYLVSADDTIYSPRVINQFLKDKISFRSCQFIQLQRKTVIIRIVPETGVGFQDEINEVKAKIGKLLGSTIELKVEIAKEPIYRGTQRKIPLIISEVKKSFSQR